MVSLPLKKKHQTNPNPPHKKGKQKNRGKNRFLVSSHCGQGEGLLQIQDQGGSQLRHLFEAALCQALPEVLQQLHDADITSSINLRRLSHVHGLGLCVILMSGQNERKPTHFVYIYIYLSLAIYLYLYLYLYLLYM